MSEKTHQVNESADKIRLQTKVKRGSGTRNHDQLNVKVKGNDPEETFKKLNDVLKELQDVPQDLRDIQPEKADE